jgi:hypothetical protein
VAQDKEVAAGAESPKGRRGESGRSQPDQSRHRAVEAYNDYTAALADTWASTDPTDRARQAYSEYLARLGEDWTPERVAERYAAALHPYLQLMEAYLDPDHDNLEAYRTYLVSLAEQWGPGELRQRARDAYESYLDAYSDVLAPDELERRSQEAWAAYIGKLKAAWSELDPSADLQTVAVLAQSAQAAIAAAQSVREVVRRRQAASASVAMARPS